MSDDDYGLGLKVHEDAYRELEEELAKAKSKLEEVGYRACCVLLERDEAREQRDRLAEALASIMPIFNFKYMSHEEKQKVRYASEVIAVVKGGNNE